MTQSTLNHTFSPSPQIGLLVIIIAFIIHLLLGMLLFLIEPTYSHLQNQAEVILIDTHTDTTIADYTTTALAPVTHEEWGEMLARKNSFGNPLSHDIPSYSSLQQQDSQPGQEYSVMPTEKKNITSQDTYQIEQEDAAASTDKESETSTKSSSPDQKSESDAPIEQSPSLQATPLTQIAEITPVKPSLQSSPAATSRVEVNQPTEKKLPTPSGQQSARQSFQHSPTQTTTQPLTLASIGRGFIEQSKYDGTYDVTMLGKKGGPVSSDQIKIERYVAKLSWCLQNSFKLLRNTIDPHIPTETEVQVYLQLTPAGAINRLEILKSSGNPLLDKHTLAVFKDAGSSFPPVPSYIKASPFAIAYHIEYGVAHDNAPLSFSLVH